MNRGTLQKFLRATRGELVPDVIIRGGGVVSVFTNRIDEKVMTVPYPLPIQFYTNKNDKYFKV